MKSLATILWDKKSSIMYLMLATVIMLFTCLGAREIWTQEHRWADIVSGMFFRHDFLHPYLGKADYYDKPLLSYWLVAAFSYLQGEVSTWALRLPSALAGMLGVWSIYRLGCQLKDRRLGLLAGWALLTTFYFIFWARTSSADMLNMAGSLFAVSWYFEKKAQPSFFNYTVFFLILACTALCKGLVGAIVPLLVIFPDLLVQGEWRRHLRFSVLLALIPAAIIYYLPFWASSHFGGQSYGESGLYLVYRENVLRYFQPFDHKGPLYTYFIFLPVYLLPWTVFFIPALFSLKSRWKKLTPNSKWIVWSVLILFVFFTLSGSRRNYYVLPLVPFAILLTADWITEAANRVRVAAWTALVAFALLFINFDVIQPLYYADGGHAGFATQLNNVIANQHTATQWQFVLLDPESKTVFYLHLSPQVESNAIAGDQRVNQTEASLLTAWPILKQPHSQIIFITRKLYQTKLQKLLPGYQVIEATPSLGERLLRVNDNNLPVAFIPR